MLKSCLWNWTISTRKKIKVGKIYFCGPAIRYTVLSTEQVGLLLKSVVAQRQKHGLGLWKPTAADAPPWKGGMGWGVILVEKLIAALLLKPAPHTTPQRQAKYLHPSGAFCNSWNPLLAPQQWLTLPVNAQVWDRVQR